MSLKIINYTSDFSSGMGEKGIEFIKQETGLELTPLDTGSAGLQKFSIRFPDMETAQYIRLRYLNSVGTMFIDADNHFFIYVIGTGKREYNYVNDLYKNIVFDSNGKLANVCANGNSMSWGDYMNTNHNSSSAYYKEDDPSKQNITLIPLRVYGNYMSDDGTSSDDTKAYVKKCYVNYERTFEVGLKFVDQNGNRFVTLGGYLLYKID